MEPNMIGFAKLASSVENNIFIVFVIVVNHVGFILIMFNSSVIIIDYISRSNDYYGKMKSFRHKDPKG